MKTVDGNEYELTESEMNFAKEVEAYPTVPDVMRIKAAMFNLKCPDCDSYYTFCISCKRLVPKGSLHKITKPKWEQMGRSMVKLDGVFVEYNRCPFCGFSVGGFKEFFSDGEGPTEWV